MELDFDLGSPIPTQSQPAVPKTMDYSRFLNVVSAARKPSAIQATVDLVSQQPPGMISLHAGVPNPGMYPFKTAQFTLKDGTVLSFDEKATEDIFREGPTIGHPYFRKQLKELQNLLHKPPPIKPDDPDGGRDICVTMGAQDGICKMWEMLISPGDNIIVDSPTYASTLAVLQPMMCNLLPVEGDDQGTKPESLRQVLSRWKPADARNAESGLPRVIYSVPNGMNPTGASLTLERRRQIYRIAREYDMLILEDDPYYFLQYNDPRVPSFLSMDEDGRVIRFDSFSKVISTGIRVGFVTGPEQLVYRLMLHTQCSISVIPPITQLLVSRLLDQWGLEGFVEYTRRIRDFYKEKKDAILKSAERSVSSQGFSFPTVTPLERPLPGE